MINLWIILHYFILIIDNIRILWILSAFCGYYPHFVDLHVPWILSTFRGYYPHFVDIIRILCILWIYPHFLDIICIGHITSYLARNFHTLFHMYSSSVRNWCIIIIFLYPGLMFLNAIFMKLISTFLFVFISVHLIQT